MPNEPFARVKVDQLLKEAGWRLTHGLSFRFEYVFDDGRKADYVLFDRQGRALAVLEAKRTSVNLSSGEAQGRDYAALLFRVRPMNEVAPDYLEPFMQSAAARSYFLRVAKRTTGIASINKIQLVHLPVRVPPQSLQTTFAEHSVRIGAIAHALDIAAAKAEAIAAALSAEAFG